MFMHANSRAGLCPRATPSCSALRSRQNPLLTDAAGIKVSLPCESASGTCFLELYIRTILALQEASGAAAEGRALPLAIMTSDDTHARTAALLEAHANFGMAPGQVSAGPVWGSCWRWWC